MVLLCSIVFLGWDPAANLGDASIGWVSSADAPSPWHGGLQTEQQNHAWDEKWKSLDLSRTWELHSAAQ